MTKYNITGMSCAACSARIEKAVSGLDGVDSCSVNLLTNSMTVEGSAPESVVIEAVKKAGYGASTESGESAPNTAEDTSVAEIKALRTRLVTSVVFLIVLMYFSMGHMMWGWPLPPFLDGNHVAMGILQMLLTIVIMVINRHFFISGFKSLWNRAPNMDTLVALGSAAAFVYSTYALFAMTSAQVRGDFETVAMLMDEFYFESAAMILTLITVGKALEARSKGKTTDALKGLMKLAPQSATIIKDGKEVDVPIGEVRIGDIFTVRPGESIPVDGEVIEGESAVDESAITGESIPSEKSVGSAVTSATLNRSGYLKCRALRVGKDTTLSQIIDMVSNAAATKAPIAKIADKVSGVFVPTVIGIALVTTAVWLFFGKSVGFALARGISVLVISCPCALGLATPVAIMVGSGLGAKNGILFKTAASLEATGRTETAVLDKTGTITSGKPSVTDIIPFGGNDERVLLQAAFDLEARSEHPLARAIVERGESAGLEAAGVGEFAVKPGNGLTAVRDGRRLIGGNAEFISGAMKLPSEAKTMSESLSGEGKTPLFFGEDKNFLGIIAVADTVREDSADAISALKNMGIEVVMLTGDNRLTAEAIGSKAGVDEIISDVLPGGKEAEIRRLQASGRVAMVGDGINDAPALTRADIGIAIGAGTDVAIDSADIVLMKSRLSDVCAAIRLSRATLRNIHENLFWAFFYNTIGIPLAAGVFIPFGITLSPMFAAAAMSLSSVSVVTNALRLNLFDPNNARHDRRFIGSGKQNKNSKEKKVMEKTVYIEGMMCAHCEAAVKKALEALSEVESASVSHEAGTAVVELKAQISDDTLKKAVEDRDYKVTKIV